MSAPRRDRLLALIAEWEDIGPDGGMRHLGPASIYRECAERLKAALRAAPEAEADLPQTKRERYLARRGADPHLRTVLTSARLILNHLHACSSEEELHRWRRAQQALIDAAIAVGRDLELNAAVGGGESR